MSAETAIWWLLVLGLLGCLPQAVLLAVRAGDRQRWQRELVAYTVTFPRGVDSAQVSAFLTGCAGLAARRWSRLFVVRAIVWETSATSEGVRHHVVVPRTQAPIVLSAIRAGIPGSRAVEVALPSHRLRVACQLGQVGAAHLLAEHAAEAVSTAVLSSLQPLASGEEIVVQWVLAPGGPVRMPRPETGRKPMREVTIGETITRLVTGPRLDAAGMATWRRKHASPVFVATGRIGVTARSTGRARSLQSRVLAALHTANTPGAHLYRSLLPSGVVAEALTARRVPLAAKPALLNAEELAGLLAVPTGSVPLPGVSVGGSRVLAPASDIAWTGRVVARSTFPGAERSLALSVADSLRHLHVVGPTGVGKSTLLLGLITQDMIAGRGVIVVDPKGDLVADVLDRVPPERTEDVVVLDPTDAARPVGLNLLAGTVGEPDLACDQVVSLFHDLYRDSWGPRTDDILRSAILTLLSVPGMTLCEVPLLLTDPGFRRPLVGRVCDPVALGPFWGWYEGLSDGERAAAIGPVMNKLRAFLLRRRLRNVIGQARPAFSFETALAERQIVLIPLCKGLLGEEAAALIGSLAVSQLWNAVQARAALPADARSAVFAYIDEFQDYLRLPTSIEAVLTQARALGLGLTLAHQHLGQLPTSVREAVLANARSRVIFQCAAGDAKTLARELAPHVTATDLQELGRYEVIARLMAGARVAPPATATTLAPPPTTGQAEIARHLSRSRYGRDRAEVEAEIVRRHSGPTLPPAQGRRRVS